MLRTANIEVNIFPAGNTDHERLIVVRIHITQIVADEPAKPGMYSAQRKHIDIAIRNYFHLVCPYISRPVSCPSGGSLVPVGLYSLTWEPSGRALLERL